jgi:hypothetical protein
MPRKIPGVISLVGSYCDPMPARNLLQHGQSSLALGRASGFADFRRDNQAVAVFRQQIARCNLISLPCRGPYALVARRDRSWIGVSDCSASLRESSPLGFGIVGRFRILIFALKALQTRPGFDERAIYSEMLVAG